MISFSNINKQYGKQLLFVDASFQLNPGEKVGLVGPNGSGKTTLFRMVVGEETPDEGAVDIRVRQLEGTCRIAVSDTGIGIPREDRKHLFAEHLVAYVPLAALIKRVLDERPYLDIAAELGTSETAVRMRVSRGLATLRGRLRNPR